VRPLRVLVGYGVLALLGVAAVPAILAYGAEAAIILGFAAFFPLCVVIGRGARLEMMPPAFEVPRTDEGFSTMDPVELEIQHGADLGYGYRR
jgi:hypothetical protein